MILSIIACTSCDSDPTGPDGPIAVTIVNADFETVHKSGSMSITAPPFTNLQGASGDNPLDLAGPIVTFSDGSQGDRFAVPGWTFTELMGVVNIDALIQGDGGNVAWFNGATFGGGTNTKSMSQTLSESLEQGRTYTLTADFGWRTDNTVASGPPILRLYAGGTELTPIESVSPALVQGEFVTWSRTYRVTSSGISGALRIEIGLGANEDGQQLNADEVTLTRS